MSTAAPVVINLQAPEKKGFPHFYIESPGLPGGIYFFRQQDSNFDKSTPTMQKPESFICMGAIVGVLLMFGYLVTTIGVKERPVLSECPALSLN